MYRRVTVTVHICKVTVALLHWCTILHPLMWVFILVKLCKMCYFLYFARFFIDWCGCSKYLCFKERTYDYCFFFFFKGYIISHQYYLATQLWCILRPQLLIYFKSSLKQALMIYTQGVLIHDLITLISFYNKINNGQLFF